MHFYDCETPILLGCNGPSSNVRFDKNAMNTLLLFKILKIMDVQQLKISEMETNYINIATKH